MSQENAALVLRWFEEGWNQRRAEMLDELIMPESVLHSDDGPIHGPDQFRERHYAPFLAAFPDLRLEVEGIIAHGDEVVVRWHATGTHGGDALGFPATNRGVTFRGITWIQVRDDIFVRGWQTSNIPEVVRELSVAAASA